MGVFWGHRLGAVHPIPPKTKGEIMARRIVPLTDAKCKKAKPKERPYKLFDGGGLYLYVLPSGAKSWRLKYRDPLSGKEKTLTFGLYPDVSLREARAKREEAKARIDSGERPGGERRTEKTFSEVAEEYFSALDLSESHERRQRRRMEVYLLPHIGRRPISKITRAEVIDLLDPIDREKVETIRRVFGLAAAVFRYAAARDYIPHPILSGIDRSFLPKKRERHYPTITDPERIGHLLRAIDTYPDEITRRALLFGILTASRPGNVRMAKWEQIGGDTWTIPAEEMKTSRPHVVPLSAQAARLLDEARYWAGESVYCFPSPIYRDRPMSDNTLNLALKRLGFSGQIVSHGFRAMFSTVAHERTAEHGCGTLVIEAQLAHKERNEVKAAYNRALYLDERRRLMQWWADWLDALR